MKNLFLILTFIFITSCNNDDSHGSLPPATTTGANTVGCLVNGTVFLPHQQGINPAVNCFYQQYQGERYFSMTFSDLRGTGGKDVNVATAKIVLEEGQTYTLDQSYAPDYGASGEYRNSPSNRYYTNPIQTGELKITRIDVSQSIVSGTFWFDCKNESGEIVEIREGRFDWNY